MPDYFRTKIAAKRQVTLPQLMLNQLGLMEGDELEFTVADGVIRAVRPYRPMPLDYFPQEALDMIARRSDEMRAGISGGYVQLAGVPAPAESVHPAIAGALADNPLHPADTARGEQGFNPEERTGRAASAGSGRRKAGMR
jgi:bifunctional DNA-binding transcriptional regulator/antitoxin component of YhaV-PrlF toxin-antitoxin module